MPTLNKKSQQLFLKWFKTALSCTIAKVSEDFLGLEPVSHNCKKGRGRPDLN